MTKKTKAARELYTFADLQKWPELTRDVQPSIRLGVFGDPVAHSLSPKIQNAAFKHHKIDMQYAVFQIAPNELADGLRLVRELDFVGLNLTVPHKIRALDYIDDVNPTVIKIRALNTVAVREGKLIGFNTDALAFSRAIRQEFAVDLRDLRVMILGAGGAARAIASQCGMESCERLVVANRTLTKANELVEQLREFFVGPRVLGPVARLQAIPWEEAAFRFQIANVDLVVNATPLGLSRTDPSPLPARLLAPHLMIYDTVYAHGRTLFVGAGLEAGARAANGLSMLVHQAALSFQTWFGREAPLELMRQAIAS
jgi:shikimate dehydrogenase